LFFLSPVTFNRFSTNQENSLSNIIGFVKVKENPLAGGYSKGARRDWGGIIACVKETNLD
jgi:hypothetical protein